MAETGYINYGTTQSNVPAELKVYYNVVTRKPDSVTIDIDIGVHYTGSWSSNGCWVQVSGEQRCCNANHTEGQRYWYASSQGNSRSTYWKRVTLSAAAANTTVLLSVGFSNKAYAAGTYQYNNFTLTIPVGNNNAYWENPTCTVTPSGTIGENTTALSVSWSGAKDIEGNPIAYNVEIWKNGSFTGEYVGGTGNTSTSGTVNISADPPGTSYYFRTFCKDAVSTSWVFGKQSSTVAKNKFTMLSSFTITSPERITPGDTYLVSCSHSEPSNSNKNTVFSYGLSAQYITSTGATASLPITGVTNERVALSTFHVTLWDGTGATPAGMYIKQSDIQAVCASPYIGMLRLNLTCSNAYGSSETVFSSRPISWRYTPSAPSAPTYSDSSYFTLPNMSEPVFIINQHDITWTWGEVIDPNGEDVTYLVYAKNGSNSWKQVATTKSRTYTTPIRAMSRSETYQIKVVAHFAYGTTSPDSIGPEITLHYYNSPQMVTSILDREQNSVMVKTAVISSTSIPNPIGSVTLIYNGVVPITTTFVQAPPYKNSFEEKKEFTGIAENLSGKITLSYKDSVMSAIFGETEIVSAFAVVTQWAPLLTIREKGLGINAVAGEFADLIAKGTVSIYGGEASGQTDGSINFGVSDTAGVNLYVGAYLDADGILRAAQDLSSYHFIFQAQFYYAPDDIPPIRWRYMMATTAVMKDAVFTANYTSTWYNMVDTSLYGVNYSQLASNLHSQLQSRFLSNSYTKGIWRQRDSGYWSGIGGTGALCIPFSSSQTFTDYVTMELTLMWQSSNSITRKIWLNGYMDSASAVPCGTYLEGLPTPEGGHVRVAWNSNTSQRMFVIGYNTTSWAGLRYINVDLITGRSGTYKLADMNPFFITSDSGIAFQGMTSNFLNKA